MIVQALSGGMSLTGEPGRPAVRSGLPIGDIAAGLYAVVAILAALRRRDQTGRGDVIDISMLDCQAAMLTYQAAYFLHSGQVPGRQGSGHDSIPTYRTFATRDGTEIVVTAISERMWRNLARALGLEALAEDPRFRTNRDRYAHRRELWPLLEAAFLTRDAEDWIGILEDLQIPVATVNTIDRVVEDPQIRHRGMVVALDARDGRQARVMGDPIAFREAPRSPHRYPPGLGEDVTVLRDVLGLSPAEIADLVSGGAVVERPPARRPDEQDA
jgi:crotonobetainyl-CoA:carnitine CoA-transferase CaiB-like acyl-CoA transferase